jgi:sugar phosphate permease
MCKPFEVVETSGKTTEVAMSQSLVKPNADAEFLQESRGKQAPTRVRYVVLAWACSLAIVTYLCRVGFPSIMPQLKPQIDLDSRHVGWLMTAFMIAYGIFEIPWGHFGDRKGGRSSLVVVVVGGSLMTAALALVILIRNAPTLALAFLLAARFLFAMFQAGTFPLLARVIADWFPLSERGTAQGAVWMASRLGGAIAPLAFIPLMGIFGNWWIPLLLMSSLGLLWSVGFWSWFRNKPSEKSTVNEAERALITAGRRDVKAVHHIPWKEIFGKSNTLALCLMYGTIGYSGNFVLFFLENYLEKHRHFDPKTAKLLTSLPFFCGLFACVLGGVIADKLGKRLKSRRWGLRIVGGTGLTIAAIGITATLGVTDARWLGFFFCLAFIGNDLAMGPSWSAASQIGERSAGALGGAMNMAGSAFAALTGIVTGEQLAAGDTTTPFILFGISYLVGALCWLRIDAEEPLFAEDGM